MFELGIIFASVTAAVELLGNQNYFEHREWAWRLLLASKFSAEWEWGTIAALAAGLKLGGMGLLFWRKQLEPNLADLAYLLRQSGWLLSALFWSGLSLSLTVSDFWFVSGAAMRAVAVISIGIMAMGPVMPEAHDGTPTDDR